MTGRGHRQPDHVEAPPAHVTFALEPLARLGQRTVVRVPCVPLLAHHHAPRPHETREVVDVPGRVVAGDAVTEPEHLLHAQVVTEHLLGALATQSAVSRLAAAQQAFLRAEQRAEPVHVDGAALEHHALAPSVHIRFRVEGAQAEPLGEPLAGGVVVLVVFVAGPAVEAPLDRRELVGRVLAAARAGFAARDDQRQEVARPGAVGGRRVEVDLRRDPRPRSTARAPRAVARARPAPGCGRARRR